MYQFNECKMDEENTVNLVSSILRMIFKIQFCYFSLCKQGSSGSEEEQQRVVAKIVRSNPSCARTLLFFFQYNGGKFRKC